MESVYNGMEFGEDWTFFLRTGRLGIPLFIHTGTNLGHAKTFEIREQHFYNPGDPDRELLNVTDARADWGAGVREQPDGTQVIREGLNATRITPILVEA